jgi:hypothetical protein
MRRLILGVLLLTSAFAVTYDISAQEIIEGFDAPVLDDVWVWQADPAIMYSLDERKGFLKIKVPSGGPYDIWSNDIRDGLLLLRHDQGDADWTIETLMEIQSNGEGYQTGLVVWSNPYIMYFWGVKCQKGKQNITYSAEQLGISDLSLSKNKVEIEDDWVTLRIEKFGKKLVLQYWDDNEESFITHRTVNFKFPVNAVGLMARTFSTNGTDLRLTVDYIKVIK